MVYRYPHDTEGNRPGPTGYATDKALIVEAGRLAKDPAFREKAKAKTAVEIIKLVHSLNYQSCEPDDWEGSDGHLLILGIINSATRYLAGYDEAAWSI